MNLLQTSVTFIDMQSTMILMEAGPAFQLSNGCVNKKQTTKSTNCEQHGHVFTLTLGSSYRSHFIPAKQFLYLAVASWPYIFVKQGKGKKINTEKNLTYQCVICIR